LQICSNESYVTSSYHSSVPGCSGPVAAPGWPSISSLKTSSARALDYLRIPAPPCSTASATQGPAESASIHRSFRSGNRSLWWHASPTGDASRQQHSTIFLFVTLQTSQRPTTWGSRICSLPPSHAAHFSVPPSFCSPSLLRMSFAELQSQTLYFLQIEIFLRDKGGQKSVEPQQRGTRPWSSVCSASRWLR
jgi:hypothetical protein